MRLFVAVRSGLLRAGGRFAPAVALLWAMTTAPAWAADTGVATSQADQAAGSRQEPSEPQSPQDQCLRAHEHSQIVWNQGDLLAARQSLLQCSRVECSPPVRGDCIRWYEQVEESLPSVVLAASYLGRDTSEVTVDLNGSRVAERLDGRALCLNPGEHRLRFVHASGRVIERTLVIHEGEKNRIVRADFDPPEPDRPDNTMTVPMTRERPAAPGPPIAKRSPLALYVAGSVAVVSAGIATFFGLSALSRARSARDPESGCEPFCPDDRVRDIRTRAIVADIGYLVSVLAAADTLYLYLAPPAPADGDWAHAPARDAHR